MRLTSKISLILLATVVTSLLLNALVMWQGVLPRFEALDRQAAVTNADRAEEAMKADIQYLTNQTQDWAFWTETREFMLGEAPEFEESNLFDDTLLQLDINILYLVDVNGRVVWSRLLDGEGEAFTLDEFPADNFPADHPILRHNVTDTSLLAGVFETSKHPVLFASGPILNNEKEGPVAGTLIMGRVFDPDRLEALQDQTSVNFGVFSRTAPEIEPNIVSQLDEAGGSLITVLEATASTDRIGNSEPSRTEVYRSITTVTGEPTYVLKATTERDIYAAGFNTVLTVIGLLGLAGIVVLAIMWAALRMVAIKPLEEFTDAIEDIGKTGSLNLRTNIDRSDEIGVLSRQFDEMLERIEKARQMLLEQSYQSGVAEMAAGVLHNLRNQLNPLVLRINRLRTTLTSVNTENVETAFAELESREADAERSQKLLEFLKLSFDEAASRRASLASEVVAVSGQIARIEEVLNEQDQFGQSERTIEAVALADIIPHAVAMMPDDVDKNITVTIDPSINDTVSVKAERMVLTHVIQNLLMNGADAIARTGNGGGEIIVKVSLSADRRGVAMADIQVCDNGDGFPPEDHERLFERGFSTKAGRKGGTGLHWCANSVSGMGGHIYADPAGQTAGAVFHVILPAGQKDVASAA